MTKKICGMAALVVGASVVAGVADAQPGLAPRKMWAHSHSETPEQLSEIPAFDSRTNTVWVAGIVGIDILAVEDGSRWDTSTSPPEAR